MLGAILVAEITRCLPFETQLVMGPDGVQLVSTKLRTSKTHPSCVMWDHLVSLVGATTQEPVLIKSQNKSAPTWWRGGECAVRVPARGEESGVRGSARVDASVRRSSAPRWRRGVECAVRAGLGVESAPFEVGESAPFDPGGECTL